MRDRNAGGDFEACFHQDASRLSNSCARSDDIIDENDPLSRISIGNRFKDTAHVLLSLILMQTSLLFATFGSCDKVSGNRYLEVAFELSREKLRLIVAAHKFAERMQWDRHKVSRLERVYPLRELAANLYRYEIARRRDAPKLEVNDYLFERINIVTESEQ